MVEIENFDSDVELSQQDNADIRFFGNLQHFKAMRNWYLVPYVDPSCRTTSTTNFVKKIGSSSHVQNMSGVVGSKKNWDDVVSSVVDSVTRDFGSKVDNDCDVEIVKESLNEFDNSTSASDMVFSFQSDKEPSQACKEHGSVPKEHSDIGKEHASVSKELVIYASELAVGFIVQQSRSQKEVKGFRFELVNTVDEVVILNPFASHQLRAITRIPILVETQPPRLGGDITILFQHQYTTGKDGSSASTC